MDAAGAPEIPVAVGAMRPLVERSQPAEAFHGADGLGGLVLPDSVRTTFPGSAVTLLRQQILAAPDPVTLVGLAPQTNLALLLSEHPEVADNLERIVVMGGSAGAGNMTPVAEFNVWQDPEAAAIVTNAGVPLTMYGLDVFTRLVIAESVTETFALSKHPAQRMAGGLLARLRSRTGEPGDYSGLIGDAGALVLLTNPELFTLKRLPMQINLSGLGRGQTIVDQRAGISADDPARAWPPVDVALDLNAEEAAQIFVEVINSFARA